LIRRLLVNVPRHNTIKKPLAMQLIRDACDDR